MPTCVIRRSGAVVRVAGGSLDEVDGVLALVFADVEFADGHLERWLGPGAPERGPLSMDDLCVWALSVAELQLGALIEELANEFDVSPSIPAPNEVFVEWHATPATP